MKKIFLVLLMFFVKWCNAQFYMVANKTLANLPMPITNTASVLGYKNNIKNLYCFGGIDSTLVNSGIHQHCYAFDTTTMVWRTLQDLPDTLGKIAASATLVNDTIYIVGGYHVFANGNELSSKRVHRFVPAIDSFIADATPIPIAIDDQAQGVWQDSLLYIISGWSNTVSVANVQIFSPKTNSWLVGTPVPNNNLYKSFGSNATIIGDTIYYFGGASAGNSFPISNVLRKGIINPINPTQITWSNIPIPNMSKYRGVVTQIGDYLVLAGGSKKTYNYNAQAYDGSGQVQATNGFYLYNVKNGFAIYDTIYNQINMDSRTVANDQNSFYICGGINDSGQVSATANQYFIKIGSAIANESLMNIQFSFYPNPCNTTFAINTNLEYRLVHLIDANGKLYKQFTKNLNNIYSIADIISGNYSLQIYTKHGWVSKTLMIEN